MKYKALLFDCDGTIADTMPIHYQAWEEVLAEWKCPFPQDLFYAWGGIPPVKIVEMLNEKHGISMPVHELLERKEKLFLERLPEVRAVPEVLKHIEEHHGKRPFAVVSGSSRAAVELTLNFLGLLNRFQTIVGSEDYTRGKPHPEPFLIAAKRLGVKPEECLVFEDADLGIESAKAAGMDWIKILSRRE